jgi:large subunit ribosomal protein L11
MATKTVKSMVEGGKAVPGPPLGPALAEAKVNIGQAISAINEKTKEFKGMKVPIEVIIDTDTKEFEIKVGTPPVSALVKKELGLDKLAKTPWTVPKPKEAAEGEEAAPAEPEKPFEASLTFDQIVNITKAKMENMGAKDLKHGVKQIIGSLVSMGVKVEDKHPKEIQKEIDEGKWNEKLK